MKECAYELCSKPAKQRGKWCSAHQEQLRRKGVLTPLRASVPEGTCNGPECDRPIAAANGLCTSHAIQKRNGKPLTPLQLRVECRHEGCTTKTRNEFCTKHRPAVECSFEGCDKPMAYGGLCLGHCSQKKRGVALQPLRVPGEKKPQTPRKPKPVKKPAEPKPVEKTYKRMRICLRWECNRKATRGDFCGLHRSDERFSNSPKCRVEDCLRPATFIPNTGFCPEHGVAA